MIHSIEDIRMDRNVNIVNVSSGDAVLELQGDLSLTATTYDNRFMEKGSEDVAFVIFRSDLKELLVQAGVDVTTGRAKEILGELW